MDPLKSDSGKKIPVILDTDIGSDIDDTWALVMLLKSPELDVKLIVSDTGNTTYRAKIAAKMLEAANRTEIPVGVGIHQNDKLDRQQEWVESYNLSSYPGIVYEDGVQAIIDTIINSPQPMTLVCIGPVPNIAAALEREPRIAEHARFVGMHGCIRKSPFGYSGKSSGVVAEYNVCTEPKALLENYGVWLKNRQENWREQFGSQSSILFDTVAVYLAFSEELLVMEKLVVRVTDDGYTVIDNNARTVNCAMEWRSLPAFESLLVERLTGKKI
jgi:inosine-uridine nucleoside N-ribohydrolase